MIICYRLRRLGHAHSPIVTTVCSRQAALVWALGVAPTFAHALARLTWQRPCLLRSRQCGPPLPSNEQQHTSVNQTGTDPSQPPGCSAAVEAGGSTVRVFFNKASPTSTGCGAKAAAIRGTSSALIEVAVELITTRTLTQY